MSDVLLNILLAFGISAATWFFARRKNRAAAVANEIENAQSALKYYREMLEDITSKYRECVGELDKVRKLIRELEDKIDLLANENRQLLEELKKYKQLNGKKE